MKNLFLALAIISLVSCQDDIQSSSPTLQGVRHGDYVWKSTVRSATVNIDDSIKIIGSDGFGTMIINLPNAIVGSYDLGQGKPSTITYTEGNTTYSTQNNGNEYPVYLGDGKVYIEMVDVENKTLRGSFYFNSYDSSGSNYMNFSDGVFYNLSYVEEQ
ncbi:MAG: DUF6252 family protein [Flavobacteriaceae bacterium]|jgi:hypothetical protein